MACGTISSSCCYGLWDHSLFLLLWPVGPFPLPVVMACGTISSSSCYGLWDHSLFLWEFDLADFLDESTVFLSRYHFCPNLDTELPKSLVDQGQIQPAGVVWFVVLVYI